MTEWHHYRRHDCRQSVGVLDLCAADAVMEIATALPQHVDVVYSDPPWNPGNAQWWRRHAGVDVSPSYETMQQAWHGVVALCCVRGAQHVLCEQSMDRHHRQLFFETQHGWALPLQQEYQVFYGSPGSASVRHPNTLLHFGVCPLRTDPTGMAGETMTIRVCAGLGLPPESWVVDPCLGKGMTSRMAHYFSWNCFATELNTARLAVACAWLEKQGYTRYA